MPLLLFDLVYALACVWNLTDLLRRWTHYADDAGPCSLSFLIARCVLGVACVIALTLLLWSSRALHPTVGDLRLLACCLVLALLASSFAQPWLPEDAARWLTRSIFFGTLLVGLLLLAAWLMLRSETRYEAPSAAHPPWLSRLEVVGVNLLLMLVISEGIVSIWSSLRPTPLLFSSSVDERLDAMRRPGGEVFFNARRNSGGYSDDEFIVAGPEDLVVAVIADSFGLGVVPMRYNFVSVAESLLRDRLEQRYERIALHNFGVGGVGLPEYARLLTTEVMATNPRLIVLCIFVGNDVHEGNTFGAPEGERYSLQRWRLWSAAKRVIELLVISREEREQLASVGGAGTNAGTIPPFIEDSSLEQPTFTPERYMEIELGRLEVANSSSPGMQDRYGRLSRGLRHFHESLGDRLLVLLLPDEFQVDDELYERLLSEATNSSQYDRDWPQRRILTDCDELGIRCLDLLPALRRAELEDRTYHLRDTHWNARGNRVVGEVLAEAIVARLE